MSALEVAMEELKALPADKLAAAVEFIHRLREKARAERNAALLKTAGTLSKEEADEWESAVRTSSKLIHCR